MTIPDSAIFAAFVAWLVGVACLMTNLCILASASSHVSQQPVREFFGAIGFFGLWVGIVVFPTCLFVVTPLLKLLPRSSWIWRPKCAACIGAMAGPFAIYLWLAKLFQLPLSLSNDPQHFTLSVTLTSALVGATFAYFYARAVYSHSA